MTFMTNSPHEATQKLNNTWPKTIPQLSQEQLVAREKWMKLWHELLPNKYGMVENFNHGFPAKLFQPQSGRKPRTLEVGAGLGEHVKWEDTSAQEYSMLEYRQEWTEQLKSKYPQYHCFQGDIQSELPFPPHSFERIIAIHVLEHLPDLPRALGEINRLLTPGGSFETVIPCEGGWAYEIAREMTSARLFRKNFGMDYRPIMKAEHINRCDEILAELTRMPWNQRKRSYFPLLIPVWHANFCIGLQFRKL